jgi:hypothetical protein
MEVVLIVTLLAALAAGIFAVIEASPGRSWAGIGVILLAVYLLIGRLT